MEVVAPVATKKRSLEDPESPPAKRSCRRQLFPQQDDDDQSQVEVDSGEVSTFEEKNEEEQEESPIESLSLTSQYERGLIEPPCSPPFHPVSPSLDPIQDRAEAAEEDDDCIIVAETQDPPDDEEDNYYAGRLTDCKKLFANGKHHGEFYHPEFDCPTNVTESEWHAALMLARLRAVVSGIGVGCNMLNVLARSLLPAKDRRITDVPERGHKLGLTLTGAEVGALIRCYNNADGEHSGLNFALEELAENIMDHWNAVKTGLCTWFMQDRLPYAPETSLAFFHALSKELVECDADIQALITSRIPKMQDAIRNSHLADPNVDTSSMFVPIDDCDAAGFRKLRSTVANLKANGWTVWAARQDKSAPFKNLPVHKMFSDLFDWNEVWEMAIAHLDKLTHRYTYVEKKPKYYGP